MSIDFNALNSTTDASLKDRSELATDNVKLIEGDCRIVLKKIDANSIHLVVTDPPYFLDGLDSKWKKGSEKSTRATGSVGKLPVGMKFDTKKGKELRAFINEVSIEIIRILKPGSFFLCFSQPRLSHHMATGIENAGFEIRDMYAWHYTKRAQMKAFKQDHFVEKMNIPKIEKNRIKKLLGNRKTPQLRPQYESIIMAQKPKDGTFVQNWISNKTGLIDATKTLDGRTPSTVMHAEKVCVNGHLTPKPIKLLSHLIELFSVNGQTVLDPFIGSGSTALAALNTGRKCIGIEIESNYLFLARERLRKQ